MFEILSNETLAPNLHKLVVQAPRIARARKAGQFVIVRADRGEERIPLTIGDADPVSGTISLFIQAIGASTRRIVAIPAGGALRDVAGPLGQPTHIENFGRVACVGGGVAGTAGYLAAWNAAFGTDATMAPLFNGCTVGQFCPGYGPPLPYQVPNADGALGGNPAISPYLIGRATPPAVEESGWKDTAKAHPGQVMRILVRFTPTSVPVKAKKSYAGQNFYPFDPTDGPGYVWHCHIIDHEDQDMMRPYKVVK